MIMRRKKTRRDLMATDKQIAANRANARRSTGPRTSLGKVKSSRNAFRHGLSGRLPLDVATSLEIDAIALALMAQGLEPWSGTRSFAEAQLELCRIRAVRNQILLGIDFEQIDTNNLKRLVSLDRYERCASHPTASRIIEFEGGPLNAECRTRVMTYSMTHFAKTNPI